MPCKNNNQNHAIVRLDISTFTELPSAQQRMHALVVSKVSICFPNDDSGGKIIFGQASRDAKKDPWWTLSFPIALSSTGSEQTTDFSTNRPMILRRLIGTLLLSRNKLIIREWRRGASWWNLNMNHENELHHKNFRGEIELATAIPLRGNAMSSKSKSSDIEATTLSMARAEIAGYRLAHAAMGIHSGSNRTEKGGNHPSIVMPEVLYFSHDWQEEYALPFLNFTMHSRNGESETVSSQAVQAAIGAPWALLSYFGEDNVKPNDKNGSLWVDNSNTESERNLTIRNPVSHQEPSERMRNFDASVPTSNYLNKRQTPKTSSSVVPCLHYPTTMTKIRHEFGFDEPHPRHGRVRTNECLDYAKMILYDVILPLQSSFFFNGATSEKNCTKTLTLENDAISEWNEELRRNIFSLGWSEGNDCEAKPFQFKDMISLYRNALNRMMKGIVRPAGSCCENGNNENKPNDTRMKSMLEVLSKYISALENEWNDNGGDPPPLPPVLCHMDLQPQNLKFWHDSSRKSECNKNGNLKCDSFHNARGCHVASVMDWEEACFADPRFELMLLCRKVLANRDQADTIWLAYSQKVKQWSNLENGNSSWDVGPIEPWLKLETAHSICTLMLQAMDLLGGGRSPWETKPDLWGKIDRERSRIDQMM